jgi:predicted peroxiredoxin
MGCGHCAQCVSGNNNLCTSYDAVGVTIDGTLLLKKGLAETVFPKEGGKPVSEFINDAIDAGVSFTACTASMELHDLHQEDLIDGIKMVGGAAMWQMAEDSKTLTF